VVRAQHILGHEVSGRVVALGPLATHHAPGDRVAIEPGVPCGACRECLSGHYNLCPTIRFLGAPPCDGALRGRVAIREDFAFALPSQLSDGAGALIEPLAVAVWACRRGRVGTGDRVLVTGAGPIGQLVAQVARASGAAEVIVTDVSAARLALAEALGATRVLDARVELSSAGAREMDVLLECSGDAAALRQGIAALRPAARAVVVGMSATGAIAVPLEAVHARELTITASFRYQRCYAAAIALAASGRVALGPLITHTFDLQDINDALRATREDPAVVKILVLPARQAAGPTLDAIQAEPARHPTAA
jgi:L-iditol 2-dehydrogenase